MLHKYKSKLSRLSYTPKINVYALWFLKKNFLLDPGPYFEQPW